MNGAAVAARGLSKRFGPSVALADLELDLAPGASLALLGPNGAGKSTLLRLAAGLTRPSRGSLCIDGEPAHRSSARARVGYVGHATLLYPALTARENLAFAARLHGLADPAARAEQLLAEEGLTAAADRPLAAFSRGMAQRVAIARGLVHDPALVLFDEPFTGLDRAAARRLVLRIEALRAAGHTLLLATHEIEHAARLSDAALVLSRGRAVHVACGSHTAAELERAYLAALEGAP
jgi:heme exporter protein A